MRRMRIIVPAVLLLALIAISVTRLEGLSAQAAAPQSPAARTSAASPQAPTAPASAGKPIPIFPATMKELMVDLIFPTSNELFYVSRTEPKTDGDWMRL